MHPTFRAWLQLFRAPNLFTVPGDPLAGYLLATAAGFSSALLLPITASLCFYGAGLLLNDLVDLEEDRRERPQRPLPSGSASIRAVRFAAAGLVAIGFAICFFGGAKAIIVSLSLIAAVVLYNCFTKKIQVLGAFNMGACRGLSLLLGAAFGGTITIAAFAAACLLAVYIAAVTHLSRFETKSSAPTFVKLLPFSVLSFGTIMFSVNQPQLKARMFFALAGIAVVHCGLVTMQLFKNPITSFPPIIGSLIRTLIFIQAALCAGSNTGWRGDAAALLLLALAPISRMMGRRFYAS